MSRPIESTRGRYLPGVGITITRGNIEDEQLRRFEAKQSPATAEEIVMSFVTPYEQSSKDFPTSKRFKKLVARAHQLLTHPRSPNKR